MTRAMLTRSRYPPMAIATIAATGKESFPVAGIVVGCKRIENTAL